MKPIRVKYLLHQKAFIEENNNYYIDAFGNVKNIQTGRILKQHLKDKNKPFSLAVTIRNTITGIKETPMVHRLVFYYFGKHCYSNVKDIRCVTPINLSIDNWQQISNLTDLNSKHHKKLKQLEL